MSLTYRHTSSTATRSGDMNNKKMSRRQPKEIVHQIFADAADTTTDDYWKEHLRNAAYNRFPKNFCYKDGFLTKRINNKPPKVSIPSDPAEACEAFCNFLRAEGGLQSDIDRSTIDRTDEQFEDWSKIRRKTLRTALIDEFIDYFLTDLCPNEPERFKRLKTQMTRTFYIGYQLKVITNDHIEFRDGRIHNIKELYYDPVNDCFFFDITKIKKAKAKAETECVSVEHKKEMKEIRKRWIKLLEVLLNRKLTSDAEVSMSESSSLL